jgi:methylated-DNA-[protein]-cysteine S-methyltransferase
MNAVARIDTPLGPLAAYATEDALTALLFDDPALARRPGGHGRRRGEGHAVLDATRRQLDEYFAGRRTRFELPLAAVGSAFQHRVWEALLAIPYGETTSYGALAAEVGAPGAARAVGLANGSNPIPIVVPCHRVIGASGKLTGYGGGLERKRALLDLERQLTLLEIGGSEIGGS